MIKKTLIGIFLVSLIGLGISSFLAYEYSLISPINCPLGGTSCDQVRQSVYSNIFGIPVPWWGIGYYIGMLTLVVAVIEKETKVLKNLLFLGGLTGVLVSFYFSYLEAFVINAWCFWCVISALCTFIIFILTVIVITQTRQKTIINDKDN